jgi:hypothetical protein
VNQRYKIPALTKYTKLFLAVFLEAGMNKYQIITIFIKVLLSNYTFLADLAHFSSTVF